MFQRYCMEAHTLKKEERGRQVGFLLQIVLRISGQALFIIKVEAGLMPWNNRMAELMGLDETHSASGLLEVHEDHLGAYEVRP